MLKFSTHGLLFGMIVGNARKEASTAWIEAGRKRLVVGAINYSWRREEAKILVHEDAWQTQEPLCSTAWINFFSVF